jgi:3-dehydroquinate dehydratase-2
VATPLVLILNGPNVNMLGTREPHIYGTTTLAEIERTCRARAASLGLSVDFRHSNHEGQLVDWIQAARADAAGIIINPGGLTHSSVSLLDALLAAGLPTIEVHLTNIHRREAFRHESYVSKAAQGVICGFGPYGYELALEGLAKILASKAGDEPAR